MSKYKYFLYYCRNDMYPYEFDTLKETINFIKMKIQTENVKWFDFDIKKTKTISKQELKKLLGGKDIEEVKNK